MLSKFNFIVFFWICAGYAMAVELSTDEGGTVLIFPFFSTENGWDSNINLIANPIGAKILKVRIRDGDRGELVKSFNVYLTRAENWRASISKKADQRAILRIAEGGCNIADDLQTGGIGTEFELDANLGSIEIYVMAELQSFSFDCDDFVDQWQLGAEPGQDPPFLPAVGKISGELSLVNVAQGIAASYLPAALVDFSSMIEHTSPSDLSPNLSEAEPDQESEGGIDAVASALALGSRPALRNEVLLLDDIAASTDWVISYPLAGYKNYKPFQVIVDGEERNCETFAVPAEEGEPSVEVDNNDQIEVFESWADGIYLGGEGLIDPPTLFDASVVLCRAVNVISFNGIDSVLLSAGSDNLSDLSGVTASDASVLRWRLIDTLESDDIGRPVLGFRITTFVNGTLDGGSTLANYAILRNHIRE